MSLEELLCFPSLVGGLQPASFATANILLSIIPFLAILLSLLPFTRNLPFMRRPNSCIVVWQQLICWLVLLLSLSLLHMGFRGSRILDSLSLRRGSSLHHRLSIMWNFSVDDGGNNRGQTFRPVVGAEMQRVCNFEECLYHHS